MANCAIFAVFSIGCIAAVQGSDDSCNPEISVNRATDQLISVINEDSVLDHVAYVQKKAAKVDSSIEHDLEHTSSENESWWLSNASWLSQSRLNVVAKGNVLDASSEPVTWTYAQNLEGGPEAGPSKWYMLEGAEACGQKGTQSPIDAPAENATQHPSLKTTDLRLQTDSSDCSESTRYVLNMFTAEMLFKDSCARAMKATWQGKDFYLSRVHYHSPSEHMQDGHYFPLEVQHVHRADDGQLLVISVMVAAGDRPQGIDGARAGFLDSVLKKIPEPAGDNEHNHFEIDRRTDLWNPYELFIPDLGVSFYYYEGSTTTPPCTTNTIWIIPSEIVRVPKSLLGQFRTLINENPINGMAQFGLITGEGAEAVPAWHPKAGMGTQWDITLKSNNRPIQPLHGSDNSDRSIWKVIAADA